MATQTNPIVLYDIAQQNKETTWSNNVFKTKLLLHYKRLPYKSIPIRAVDIHPTLRGQGFDPTWHYKGDPVWTVPAIVDPPAMSTGATTAAPKLVAESRVIAEYLDNAYPNTPRAFPPKDSPLYQKHEELLAYFTDKLMIALVHILTPAQLRIVDADCATGMNMRFSPLFFEDKELDSVFRGPEERKKVWSNLKASLDGMSELMDKIAPEAPAQAPPADEPSKSESQKGPYMFGAEPYFIDIVLLAHFMWARIVPCDRDEGIEYVWDVIKEQNNGRWKAMMEAFERAHGTQWPVQA